MLKNPHPTPPKTKMAGQKKKWQGGEEKGRAEHPAISAELEHCVILLINKLDSRFVVVQFCNHSHDDRLTLDDAKSTYQY